MEPKKLEKVLGGGRYNDGRGWGGIDLILSVWDPCLIEDWKVYDLSIYLELGPEYRGEIGDIYI